jgi:hypothetical protein
MDPEINPRGLQLPPDFEALLQFARETNPGCTDFRFGGDSLSAKNENGQSIHMVLRNLRNKLAVSKGRTPTHGNRPAK